jgi:hypothetical protein
MGGEEAEEEGELQTPSPNMKFPCKLSGTNIPYI